MEDEVTFRPNEGQSVAATRDRFLDVLRSRRTAVMMLGMTGISSALFADIAWSEGASPHRLAVGIAEGALYGAGAMVVMWALSFAILPYRARRLFRQQRVGQGDYRWRWSREGIGLLTPNGEVRYAWSEIHRIVRGRSAFLLFFNDHHYLALPLEVLDAQQQRSFAAAAAGRSSQPS